MGRQTKIQNTDLAYIAGFLDGDGSVMVQVKRRRDTPKGWRLMFTICFYQDTRHERPLKWIRSKLRIGYISRRNDGITELRINGYDQVHNILILLYPYIKFKRKQLDWLLKAFTILKKGRFIDLKIQDRRIIAKAIVNARKQSYQSGLKRIEKLKSDLEKILEF